MSYSEIKVTMRMPICVYTCNYLRVYRTHVLAQWRGSSEWTHEYIMDARVSAHFFLMSLDSRQDKEWLNQPLSEDYADSNIEALIDKLAEIFKDWLSLRSNFTALHMIDIICKTTFLLWVSRDISLRKLSPNIRLGSIFEARASKRNIESCPESQRHVSQTVIESGPWQLRNTPPPWRSLKV